MIYAPKDLVGIAYVEELRRIHAWHRTFNAALTGLVSGRQRSFESYVPDAKLLADAAHGPLEPA